MGMRAIRTAACAALVLLASAAVPAPTGGKPGERAPGIAIAHPAPIVLGSAGSIVGRLTGRRRAGRTAVLYADAHPYDRSRRRASTLTDRQGDYRFTVAPRVNTRYRVRIPGTTPTLTSASVMLEVRFRVSLSISDPTPRAGSRVRFSGWVRPARDGRLVRLQRFSSRGTFATVARTRLRDAGARRSRYSRRLRINRSGLYRVRVGGDRANATASSRAVTIAVG